MKLQKIINAFVTGFSFVLVLWEWRTSLNLALFFQKLNREVTHINAQKTFLGGLIMH